MELDGEKGLMRSMGGLKMGGFRRIGFRWKPRFSTAQFYCQRSPICLEHHGLYATIGWLGVGLAILIKKGMFVY